MYLKRCSLRQYDLDQVIRVERGSLLSVPHRGTPRSIVIFIVLLLSIPVNSKMAGLICNRLTAASEGASSHPAPPFLFHLQFARILP